MIENKCIICGKIELLVSKIHRFVCDECFEKKKNEII